MIACLAEIDHKLQRYETVGDYFLKHGKWQIIASKMPNPDFATLVQIHELVELVLTQKRGIREDDITNFDLEYESRRPEGDFSEPGDDDRAPYHLEHVFATKIERMVADELGVDWEEYDRTVREL